MRYMIRQVRDFKLQPYCIYKKKHWYSGWRWIHSSSSQQNAEAYLKVIAKPDCFVGFYDAYGNREFFY